MEIAEYAIAHYTYVGTGNITLSPTEPVAPTGYEVVYAYFIESSFEGVESTNTLLGVNITFIHPGMDGYLYRDIGNGWENITFMEDNLTLEIDEHELGIYAFLVPVHNHPPVADAGANLTANVGEVVVFNASRSFDMDNDALTYYWEFGDGSVSPVTSSPIAEHIYKEPGEYRVTLHVSDGRSESTDVITVIIYETQPQEDIAILRYLVCMLIVGLILLGVIGAWRQE